MSDIHLADTATRVPPEARAGVVICGSHGGIYAGYLVARAGARAVILNDAGVGLDAAGIGSLPMCDAIGMAAAAVAHTSARIGDASDMATRGLISHVNAAATAIGCRPGMPCREAAALLRQAEMPASPPPAYAEARHVLGRNAHGLRIVCVDSVSLVEAEDEGQIVLSGSHGGVVSTQPHLAIKVEASLALFNDAGIGIDEAGIGRLPVLDERSIAAATVDAMSARIGDGRSTYEQGIVSRVNHTARRLGLVPGMRAKETVQRASTPSG